MVKKKYKTSENQREQANLRYAEQKESILLQARKRYASDLDFKNKAIQRAEKRYKEKKEDYRKKRRAYHLWHFFRITPEEYDVIKSFMENHKTFNVLLGKNGGKKNAVEHRHKDGLVRGLMAVVLNRAYGIVERLYPNNTSEVLRALADFHDNPPATTALGLPKYGIIGKSKSKKVMIYGSPNGPLKPEKKGKK